MNYTSLCYLSVLPTLFLLSFLSGNNEFSWFLKPGQTPSEEYYSIKDFKKVKKKDIHIHINTDQESFIELAEDDNFQLVDIVDDRPFGLPMAEQQTLAFHHLRKNPGLMAVATTFSTNGWENKNWVKETIDGLKKSISKFVMVDDNRLDPVLDYLEKNGIPLIGHNGEPRDCWMPLNKMTFSKGYYSSHPEYHMYLHPEYPSYDDQINARDNMLKKHPYLRFVGAHLGSLEWSLGELAKRFDKYPNMSVDLSRISNLQLHTLKNWKKTRNFFIKYQDRLVYGSDKTINASNNPDAFKKGIHDSWLRDWVFFATNEKIDLQGFGELKGLHLPKTVIDKIYFENGEKWLNGTD